MGQEEVLKALLVRVGVRVRVRVMVWAGRSARASCAPDISKIVRY